MRRRRLADFLAVHLKGTIALGGLAATVLLYAAGHLLRAHPLLSGFLVNLSASAVIIVVTVLLVDALQEIRTWVHHSESAVMAYDKIEIEIRNLVGLAKVICLDKEEYYIDDPRTLEASQRSLKTGKYWEFPWVYRKLEVEKLCAVPDERLAKLTKAKAGIIHEDLIRAARAVYDVIQLHGSTLDGETASKFIYVRQMLNDCWDSEDRQASFIKKLRSPNSRIGEDGAYYMRCFFDALEQSCDALSDVRLARHARYYSS